MKNWERNPTATFSKGSCKQLQRHLHKCSSSSNTEASSAPNSAWLSLQRMKLVTGRMLKRSKWEPRWTVILISDSIILSMLHNKNPFYPDLLNVATCNLQNYHKDCSFHVKWCNSNHIITVIIHSKITYIKSYQWYLSLRL